MLQKIEKMYVEKIKINNFFTIKFKKKQKINELPRSQVSAFNAADSILTLSCASVTVFASSFFNICTCGLTKRDRLVDVTVSLSSDFNGVRILDLHQYTNNC